MASETVRGPFHLYLRIADYIRLAGSDVADVDESHLKARPSEVQDPLH